ncbi:MAG: BMP family ABC transporter substrate-binding protein [Nitrososphaerota archaeon]|nr:BMP family ABC transporter substrate-binding protein [Candidatus Calditenuaceae archaeon]MDW8073025.1 BMP family ABC transporter substrate-binding protein [Nitrososphaerota archaeon]
MSHDSQTRRSFLGSVNKALLGGLLLGGVVGSLGTYAGTGGGGVTTVERAVTVTRQVERRLKAGYVYIGPAKDYGWSFSHDQGRRWADRNIRGVESVYIEGVGDADVKGAMKTLIEVENVDFVVGTSFGYMDPMAELASEYPEKYFLHINGFRAGALGNAPENMSVGDINTYQIYYLEGLAAGAVTQTGAVGVVGTFRIPVINRLVNAFLLGARYAYKKRTGKEIKARVVWLNTWFDPVKARDAVISLVDTIDADVITSTEDSPTGLQVVEEYTTKKGRRTWGFSHYTDMTAFGPNSHLTGHIVNWGVLYLEFYKMILTGSWRSVDIWARLGDFTPSRWAKPPEQSTLGKPEGPVYMAPLNPVVPAEWELLIKRRYEEMKEGVFEPISGEGNMGEPVRDTNGEVRIDRVERANRTMLMNMDWIVEYALEA